MRCKDVIDLLPLYQRKQLKKAQSDAVADHLASCQQCMAAEEIEKQISDSLDTLFSAVITDIDSDRTVEAVLRSEKERVQITTNRFGSRSKWVWGMVASAAVIVITVWLSVVLKLGGGAPVTSVRRAAIRPVEIVSYQIREPEFRDLVGKVSVKRLKKNIVWVSIHN